MSKKTKKATILVDGTEYRVINWTNATDTNVKYVPQNPPGVIGSGLHIPEKNKQRTHFDMYNGKEHLKGQEKYIGGEVRFPPLVIINLKEHFAFHAPPDNHILVLRGREKPTELISLEYYNKNKEEYLKNYNVKIGTEDDPQVLELK